MTDAPHFHSSPDRSDLRRDDALLPCPFCGGKPEACAADIKAGFQVTVDCTQCGATNSTIEMWNIRAPLPGAHDQTPSEPTAWIVSGGDGYERQLFETRVEAKAFATELYENGWDDVVETPLYAGPSVTSTEGHSQ